MSTVPASHTLHALSAGSKPPPVSVGGDPLAWARRNLFYSWSSTIITILLAAVLAKGAIALVNWAFINAIWSVPSGPQGPITDSCRALEGAGACWAIIADKYRFMLFGMYPFDEQWRPAIVTVLFISLYVVSSRKSFWRASLAGIWVAALLGIGVLMWGGVFGLEEVPQSRWGGLALTLILATVGVAVAFPLGILVALGRRSQLPFIRWLCVGYVEVIRGVPLITLLFMASVMFPLLLPEGMNLDKLLRAQIAIILFFGAYLAEVVRGGLQALPKGQGEAAHALGLSYWQMTRRVVLPQALRMVIPPLVNNFIGFFKDTSLVLVIGLYDLLAASRAAVGEPAWQGFAVETYVFVGLIYFVFCFAMSKYSQNLEVQLNQHRKR
ncbi:amino acid ABC transporter permease [Variovorax ginsengisoli]|uniref:Amino acid ABC transporter permease n=1 Tax=Variovorax ginsengisoli TaxID=363844 RepID=A0ABT8SCP0_9BURK|nr:amino acid ABC transporter permease [Variovorax ginsengisoli]MDN8617350.1 amino acid ABC transporter permease [Variovorax ginsengisoli]MDO1536520.1 amino acid ABC transporter permease [Variovorax ginsengisoli]